MFLSETSYFYKGEKMNKLLNIYLLNDRYYNFLHNIKNLKEILIKKDRPYIGYVGIKINNQDYVIPLTHNDSNSYKECHKYSLPIFDENENMISILKINKMLLL